MHLFAALILAVCSLCGIWQGTHFRKGLPNAKVVTIPYASHYVYISNKAEVLRDINAFIETLPKN